MEACDENGKEYLSTIRVWLTIKRAWRVFPTCRFAIHKNRNVKQWTSRSMGQSDYSGSHELNDIHSEMLIHHSTKTNTRFWKLLNDLRPRSVDQKTDVVLSQRGTNGFLVSGTKCQTNRGWIELTSIPNSLDKFFSPAILSSSPWFRQLPIKVKITFFCLHCQIDNLRPNQTKLSTSSLEVFVPFQVWIEPDWLLKSSNESLEVESKEIWYRMADRRSMLEMKRKGNCWCGLESMNHWLPCYRLDVRRRNIDARIAGSTCRKSMKKK